jgi:hypothetical protein
MAGFNLGNLFWKISADSAQLDKGLGDSEKKINSFSTTLKNAGKKLTTFLTLPILGAAGASIKAASDLEESQNAVQVVFGETASVLEEFGRTAATSAGLTQASFNESATVLGASLKNAGLSMDDVAQRTITLTQRAADLGSVFNKDVNEVLGAFQSAIRGEAEPIEKFGVQLTAAAVEAEALASGLVSSKDEITEQIKVQARLNLILGQTADAQGDFANTSDSVANSTRILTAQINDVAAELGKELLPIVKDVLSGIRDLVSGFSNLTEEQKQAILVIGGVATALGPALTLFGKLKDVIAVMGGASAGVLGIFVAGIIGLTAAFNELNEEIRRNKIQEFSENLRTEFKDLQTELDLTDEKFFELFEKLSVIAASSKLGIGDLEQQFKALAGAAGLTETELLKIVDANDEIKAQFGDQLDDYRAQVRQTILANDEEEQRNNLLQERLAIRQEIREEAEATETALSEATQAELALINDFATAYRGLNDLQNKGLIDREEYLTRAIDLQNQEIERLEARALLVGYITAQDEYRIALIEEAIEKNQEELDSIGKKVEATEKLATVTDGLTKEQRRARRDQKLAALEALKEAKALEQAYKDIATALTDDVTALGLGGMRDALIEVGSAIVNSEDAALSFARITLKTLSEILSALGSQLAALAAVNFVQLNIPGGIAATAGSAAAFVASGAIGAAANQFADGGIVPGDPSRGDSVPAVLTPGEIILNEAQQENLLGNMGSVIINQNNLLNLANQEGLERAARELFPALQREGLRRGEKI